MTMEDAQQQLVETALSEVVKIAKAAQGAPDLDASLAQLSALWFATHTAQEVLRAADRITRANALAKLEAA